ncbi:hypothetical protein I4U23_000432 [Adineta vaga]|nr:hypothetical protein I4U23_000432 [Adineta vaga]
MSYFWLFYFLINSSIISARYIRLSTVNCSELSPIGTSITQFLDVLPRSNWEFTFLTQTLIKSYFLLDHLKSTLIIQRLLDRENLCQLNLCSCLNECLIKLEINAISNTSTHIFSLPIHIFDENDNYCYFSNEIFYLNLNENIRVNTRIILPIAYDPDLPPNNIQSYDFLQNNYTEFHLINHLTPTMIIRKQLDRETLEKYQLILCAYEGIHQQQQQRSCCTKIIINIIDINDNSPKFEHNQQFPLLINVSESTPIRTELIQMKASDSDEGLNGQIRYRFSKWDQATNEIFEINSENGSIILIKQLDYEKRTKYQLHIQAKDMGINTLPTYATVIIQVIDENVCIPEVFIFSPPDIQLVNSSSIYIFENISLNTSILYVTVSDGDSGENGRITVGFISTYSFLYLQKINNNTYMFSTKSLFDREEKSFYSFSIITYDHGQPSHSIINTFNLYLLDINDCYPYFDLLTNYSFTIDENNEANVILHTIQTFDSDENDQIILKLENEDNNLFDINDQNQLVIKKRLDYEIQSSYHFNLTAEDLIGHRTTIPIHIYLNDINDNPVRFLTNFTQITIHPNPSPETFLGHVHVEDKDSNAQITYHLQPNSIENFIELKSNGSFYIKRKFSQKELRQFDILANDSFHTDLIHIEILIDDRPILKTSSPYCFPLRTNDQIRIQLEASSNVTFALQNSSSSSDLFLFPTGLLIVKSLQKNYSLDIFLQNENSSSIFRNFILLIQSECHTNDSNQSYLFIIISCLLCLIIIIITMIIYLCFQQKKFFEKKNRNLTPLSYSSSLNDTLFFSSSSPQFTAMTIISSNSSSTHPPTNPSSSLSSSSSSTYIKMSRSFEDEMI